MTCFGVSVFSFLVSEPLGRTRFPFSVLPPQPRGLDMGICFSMEAEILPHSHGSRAGARRPKCCETHAKMTRAGNTASMPTLAQAAALETGQVPRLEERQLEKLF